MNNSKNMQNINYPILSWDLGSFTECCGTILANSSQHIHRIKLNKSDEVYLVPKEFYLAAKGALKEIKNNKEL